MDSKNKLVKDIDAISSRITQNIINFSFIIKKEGNPEVKSMLEMSFIIHTYGYLEGFIKKISKDYLAFVFEYCKNKPDVMSIPLYYLHKFKDFNCKNTNKYFKEILKGLDILNIDDSKEYNIKANNNLKYNVLIIILHLLQFDLKNYEAFKYSFEREDNSRETKELDLKDCLDAFVNDRNQIAHGGKGYLEETFQLSYKWEEYKTMVLYILKQFTDEVKVSVINESFLR